MVTNAVTPDLWLWYCTCKYLASKTFFCRCKAHTWATTAGFYSLVPIWLRPSAYKLFYFAYPSQKWFYDIKTSVLSTTARGNGLLFPLCSSSRSEKIHAWASSCLLRRRFIYTADSCSNFLSLQFVQLACSSQGFSSQS